MINKFIRIQVIGFFIFTILLLGNVYSNSEVFLKQEATGENIEKARANALALLSQNFLVFVKSDFESNISVENKKVDSKSKNNIDIKTIGLFKGIKFINEKKVKKNIFTTTVVFDIDSYNQTKESLVNYIEDNKNINMSKYAISLQKEKLLFLIAVMDFGKTKNIAIDENEYKNLIAYSKKLTLESSNMAKITFNINGTKNVDAILIKIADKEYKNMETVYLNKGKYVYSINNPLYLLVENTIEVQNEDKKQIDIFLEKNMNKKLPVKIVVDSLCSDINKESIVDEFKNVIGKHQLILDVKSNKSIKIAISGCSENKINDKFSTYNMIVKYSIVDRMETKYIVAKEIKKVVDNNFKQVGIFTNQDVFESMDEMLSQLLNGENIELIK
jgi:hypothetical protein